MKPCISEATTMPATFMEDVDACAAAGCPALEVWLTKLETHLLSHDAAETKLRIADRGVALSGAAYQGGLLLSQGDQRKAHFDHFKKRLSLCESFGIATMLIVADFARQVQPTDLERAVVSLKQAAQWAAGFGVRLALEFRGADTFCSNLDTAMRLIASAGEPNLGVCLDLFHFYKGPSKTDDLNALTRDNLMYVQLSDVSGVPRELMTDSDRVMPGDGDFGIEPVVEHLRRIGYEGWISLELMNPVMWQLKPSQVMELGYSSLTRALKTRVSP
jgi:sugar phosphate isomerase/epimerase